MPKDQVKANYDSYVAHYQAKLEAEAKGKIALMHDGDLIQVSETHAEAYWHGVDNYGLGNFSIQEIGERPAELGILAFAV